jgi:hypothetical protein
MSTLLLKNKTEIRICYLARFAKSEVVNLSVKQILSNQQLQDRNRFDPQISLLVVQVKLGEGQSLIKYDISFS